MKYFIGVFVLTLQITCNLAYGQSSLKLARIEQLAEQEIAEKMLINIYSKLAIHLNVVSLPGARAKIETSIGAYDGEVLRVFSYGKNNPAIVRVPTSYSSLETTAFALKGRQITIENKSDLELYHIVVIRGVQHTKDITRGLKNVHEVDNGEQMMRFLALGRADVALTNTLAGSRVVKHFGLDNIEDVGTLETLPLYHYLHVRNKALVKPIDNIIKGMKTSGELNQLRQSYKQDFDRRVELNRRSNTLPDKA